MTVAHAMPLTPEQLDRLADTALTDARAATPERAARMRALARRARRRALLARLRQHAQQVGPANVTATTFRAHLRDSKRGATAMTSADTAITDPGEREIARLSAEIDQLRQDRTAFGDRVRDLIIRQHRDLDWCVPGVNRALDDLGLPEFDPTLTGTATIRVRFRADTTDADDAHRWAALAITPHSNDGEVQITSSEIDIEVDDQP